ncbi:MAG: transcription elongation factor GreA [Lachnospiraceae bacterium]|nr:transcription elongation factor GreA [Lachnospiraceae bacterium]
MAFNVKGEDLTPGDVEKIQAEIDHRKLELRPKLIEEVKEARAQGDLSENFEYYAAKKAKNENESRIGYLERMLKFANVISEDSAADEVGMNNFVTVEFLEDGEKEKIKIVTSIRGDSLKNYISIESPFGKALLGHKVGDVCKVNIPGGGYEVKILEIDKSSDDSEDKLKSF